MPFCTSCGNNLDPQAKFCPRCGASMNAPGGGATTTTPVLDVAPDPLEYTIHGDNLQVARIKLKPGQELYAEAGKMLYKTANISWETRMTGDSLGAKIWGAVKRKLMGESLFLTYFRTSSPGDVGFAGNYPG